MNKPIYTFSIIFLTVLLILNPTHPRRQLMTGLTQVCPTIESVKKQKDSDPEKNELFVNVQNFEDSIVQPESEALGDGGFGTVFNYEYFFVAPGKSGSRKNAVKVVTVYDDANHKNGKKYQGLYQNEVTASMEVNTLDPDHLYLPRFDGCVEVTDDFRFLETEESVENKAFIKKNPNTATFLYFTQKLDIDLFKFINFYKKGLGPMFDQVNRIQLAINLFKGMSLFNQKYIHCDMKPENIMLKSISEEKTVELLTKNYKAIETGPGHNYQSFIIDFGLSVKKTQNQRNQGRCIGGTPGFFPPEMFNDESQNNFDVYGMAMLMIDLELANLKQSNLSDVFAPSHLMQYDGYDTRFPSKSITQLNKEKLYLAIKTILDSDSVKDQINESIQDFNPNFQTLISQSSKALQWGVNKPSEFLTLSPSIFDTLVMSVMSFFHLTPFFTHDVKSSIASLTEMLNEYKKEVQDGNNVESNQSNIEFAEASIRVQNEIKDLRREYYEILLDMIQPLERRKLFPEAIQEIENLLAEFKRKNKDDLRLLDEAKEESARALQMKRFSETSKRTGAPVNQESSRRRQENIDQVMESRRKRMGSLYKRRRLML